MKKIITITILSSLISSTIYAASFSTVAQNLSNGIIATITKLSFSFAVVFFF
jgi:hypothetical protein